MRWDSLVGIATGYWLESHCSIPDRAKNCSPSRSVHTDSGATQPHIQCVPGAFSPGVKREADHSPPCSAEFKNGGAVPPLSNTSAYRIS
jgi:hypothetical protein